MQCRQIIVVFKLIIRLFYVYQETKEIISEAERRNETFQCTGAQS